MATTFKTNKPNFLTDGPGYTPFWYRYTFCATTGAASADVNFFDIYGRTLGGVLATAVASAGTGVAVWNIASSAYRPDVAGFVITPSAAFYVNTGIDVNFTTDVASAAVSLATTHWTIQASSNIFGKVSLRL